MAQKQGQPTAQTSALLERVGPLLVRTEEAFGNSAPEATVSALLAEWSSILKAAHADQDSHEGKTLMSYIMTPVIAGALPSEILFYVFGDKKKAAEYTGIAEDWNTVCKIGGAPFPTEFIRPLGWRAYDAFQATAGAPVSAKPGSVFLAYAQRVESNAGVGSRLLRWLEKTYDRSAADKVAAEVAKRTGGQPAPDPKAALSAKIAETETAMQAAAGKGTPEGFAEAGKLAGELAELRKQLEALAAAPPPAPTPATPITTPTQPPAPVGGKGGGRKGLFKKVAEVTGLAAPTPPAPAPAPAAAPAQPVAEPDVVAAPAGPNGGVMDVDAFKAEVKGLGLERSEAMALVVRFGSDPTGAVATLEALKSF